MSTTDQPYTPHESTVRLAYLHDRTSGTAHTIQEARAEFYRFLARVRAEAAADALREAADKVARQREFDYLNELADDIERTGTP